VQRSFALTSLLSFAFACATVASASAEQTPSSAVVLVPAGTVITLTPNGTGGMAGAHNVGDPIDFTVMKSVIIDGWVVIPKGAPAHGTIADLTSAGVRFGGGFSQASLKFSFDWVQLVAGKLKLDNTPVEVKGRQIKRKVTVFGMKRDTPDAGFDPFLTAVENGVDSTTASSVHVPTSQRATALEQAEQTNTFIDK